MGKSHCWAAYQWMRICLEKHAPKNYPLQNDTFCLSPSPTKSSRSVIAFIAGRAFILPQQVGIMDFEREFPTASLSWAERCRVEPVSVWCPVRFRAHLPDSIFEFIKMVIMRINGHFFRWELTAEPPCNTISSACHATEDWLFFFSVLVGKELLIRGEEYERDHKVPGKAFITSSALSRPYIYI